MKKILVVDDSEIIRTQIKQCFNDKFSDIYIAKNGKDAVEKMHVMKPDVVTMDLTMPEMDGVACITKLVEVDPKVRILVVSALSDNATCMEALKRGASGFLDKPFTEEELREAIDILLEE